MFDLGVDNGLREFRERSGGDIHLRIVNLKLTF